MARSVSLSFDGGAKLRKTLMKMGAGLGSAKSVSVGFLADAQYPQYYSTRVEHRISPKRTTTSVAQVAFWNEFGAPGAHVPARPALRTMIAEKSPQWGDSMAYLARVHHYNAKAILTNMGEGIKDQMREAIMGWDSPPNSKVTVAIKGFNKPLTDEGIMKDSLGYEVTGSEL